MQIRLWGTRGSIPSPGPSTARYGGNTSCVEVRLSDGSLIILDAGSGLRPLGLALGTCQGTLLLSHYHWDHIQGMPFFAPAYNPQSAVHVYGPEFEGQGPEEILGGQMAVPYFPAPPSQWLGIKGYSVVQRGEPLCIGSAVVRPGLLSHPGTTFGYRIEDGEFTFVYISDNEVDTASPELRAGIVELAEGADVLLHDCQFTEAEYTLRQGWGHSTPRQVAAIADDAEVQRVLLFHHDPSHSDEQVEALAEEASTLMDNIAVGIAREGDILTLAANLDKPALIPRRRSAS